MVPSPFETCSVVSVEAIVSFELQGQYLNGCPPMLNKALSALAFTFNRVYSSTYDTSWRYIKDAATKTAWRAPTAQHAPKASRRCCADHFDQPRSSPCSVVMQASRCLDLHIDCSNYWLSILDGACTTTSGPMPCSLMNLIGVLLVEVRLWRRQIRETRGSHKFGLGVCIPS